MIQLRCASPFQTGTSRTSFRVSDHIGRMKLHEVWLNKETGFTAARTANDQYIFVSGILRLLGAAVHGQKLRLREDNIV